MLKAYQFGYKITALSKTTYIWVIASSEKQAWYFMKNKYGNFKNYYWVGRASWDIEQNEFLYKHAIGQVIGDDTQV